MISNTFAIDSSRVSSHIVMSSSMLSNSVKLFLIILCLFHIWNLFCFFYFNVNSSRYYYIYDIFCFHVLFHLFLRINIRSMHYYYLHFTKPRPGESK